MYGSLRKAEGIFDRSPSVQLFEYVGKTLRAYEGSSRGSLHQFITRQRERANDARRVLYLVQRLRQLECVYFALFRLGARWLQPLERSIDRSNRSRKRLHTRQYPVDGILGKLRKESQRSDHSPANEAPCIAL